MIKMKIRNISNTLDFCKTEIYAPVTFLLQTDDRLRKHNYNTKIKRSHQKSKIKEKSY